MGICADNHERLLAMVADGLTGREIAEKLGTTRSAVLGHCHRHKITLPRTPRKKAIQLAAIPRGPGSRGGVVRTPARGRAKFPPGHAAHRSRVWGGRAFTDQEIAIAIARHLAGMPGNRAASSIGASWQSLRKWERVDGLYKAGRVLFEKAREEAARVAAARAAQAAREAEVRAAQIAAVNAPILAKMPARHRAMMQRRIDGDALQAVGNAHGITRERVRQIEVKWRLRGLVVPDAAPLSDAAIRTFSPVAKRTQRETPSFYAADHALLKPEQPQKRPYRLTEGERERRRAWGRELARRMWSAPA